MAEWANLAVTPVVGPFVPMATAEPSEAAAAMREWRINPSNIYISSNNGISIHVVCVNDVSLQYICKDLFTDSHRPGLCQPPPSAQPVEVRAVVSATAKRSDPPRSPHLAPGGPWMEERPWRGFGNTFARNHGTAVIGCGPQDHFELDWPFRSIPLSTKALGKLDEVRVHETLAYKMSTEGHLVVAQYISKTTIV